MYEGFEVTGKPEDLHRNTEEKALTVIMLSTYKKSHLEQKISAYIIKNPKVIY